MQRFVVLLLASALSAAGVTPSDIQSVRTLLRESRFAEASSAVQSLRATHPDAPWTHALEGLLRIAQEDGTGAVRALEKARELAPNDSEIHRALGDAYETAVDSAGLFTKLSLARKCLAAYERAVELDPQNLAARQSLLGFYVGAPVLYGGSRPKAWQQAKALMQLDPVNGHLAAGLLLMTEDKHAEAAAEFDRVLQLAPDNYFALYQTGRLAALTGKGVERGIASLQRAIKQTPPDDAPGHDAAYWRLGMLWQKHGDLPAAQSAYEASLRLNPKFKDAAEALRKLKEKPLPQRLIE